jgi:outer membrane biosynthesis protein TonB
MHAKAVSIPSDRSLPLMLALLLVACATQQALEQADLPRSGNVAMTEVNAADEQSYAMDADAQWVAPQAFYENEAPVYPPELLAANLPSVKVRVRVIVDERGVVADSTAIEAPADYPQFFSAVQAVVGGWKYWPLVKVIPTHDGTRTEIVFNGFVSTYEGKATALPFHQDYEFTFTQRDGQGVVTSSSPASDT